MYIYIYTHTHTHTHSQTTDVIGFSGDEEGGVEERFDSFLNARVHIHICTYKSYLHICIHVYM